MDKRETREIKRRSECRNVLCIKILLPFEFSKRNFVSPKVRPRLSSYLRHAKFSQTENCVIVEKLKRDKHFIISPDFFIMHIYRNNSLLMLNIYACSNICESCIIHKSYRVIIHMHKFINKEQTKNLSIIIISVYKNIDTNLKIFSTIFFSLSLKIKII